MSEGQSGSGPGMLARIDGSALPQLIEDRRNLVRPERFELPTYCSGGNRSIHLSYGRPPIFSLHGRFRTINEKQQRRRVRSRARSERV
jgi:hypothetical protein